MKKMLVAGIIALAILNGGVYANAAAAKDAKDAKAVKAAKDAKVVAKPAVKATTTKPAAKTAPAKPTVKATYTAFMDMYDRNLNGKIEDSEKLGMKEKEKVELDKILAKYDTDKDGMLNDAEKAAMTPAAAKTPAAK